MEPSSWVLKFAELVPEGAKVLDLACGKGRHSRLFLNRSCLVSSVDTDCRHIQDLADNPNCKIICADLEKNDVWGLPTDFDAIIVTNYLHRPLLKHLSSALAPNGILIYQTFMIGNESYGKPSNPDYLLTQDELKNSFEQALEIIEFSQGHSNYPKNAVTQQLCARRINLLK